LTKAQPVILHVPSIALPKAAITGIMPRLMTWKPLHIFAMALAGWMNREQQDAMIGSLAKCLGHQELSCRNNEAR
jgi:hypothetical protein